MPLNSISYYIFGCLLCGAVLCSIGVPVSTTAPNASQGESPASFTTAARRVRIKDAGNAQLLKGRASLTLLEAYPDDSLRAIVTLTVERSDRLKIKDTVAALSPRETDPSLIEPAARLETRLRWHNSTSCPNLAIDLPALTFQTANAQLITLPTRFEIELPQTAADSLSQLLCNWTRQINARRPRTGVIMAINRHLLPVPK